MLNATEGVKTEGRWQAAHAALVELARERAGLDYEEGLWLLTARRAQAHRELGYGSFTEYIDRLFGYAPRLTHEKLRVAEALETLPELARELQAGAVTFSQVRELTRVATPETEKIWLKRAQGCTSRQVEKLVSGRKPGDVPESPADPALELHVIRFEVKNDTRATLREAIAKLRQAAGEHLDDDAILLLLARHVLAGPTDDGRASYQIAMDLCEDCQRAKQLADGETIHVSPEIAHMAQCDAQWVPSAHLSTNSHLSTSAHLSTNSRVSTNSAPAVERATQDVAPAIRRQVLRRDHHRCQVPGCSHATFVDVHHIETRADGGNHDANNLLTLCGAHHRAVHEGTLRIVGSVDGGVTFLHADGTRYGAPPDVPTALLQARAFRALRALGFGEREARHVLEQTMQDCPDTALDAVLRQCLRLLSEHAWTKAS